MKSVSPTARGLPGKIGLLVVSSLVALLVAELGLRWTERPPAAGRVEDGSEALTDLEALGFNNPPVSRTTPEGEFRILGLGDSFAFGPVKYPNTYYAVAGATLSLDSAQAQAFRFINLGEPGISFPHYLQRYAYWREIIEHDAAVFTVYLGNDLLDLALGHAPTAMGLNEKVRQSGLEVRPGHRIGALPKKYPLRLLDHLRYRYLLWSGAARAPSLEADSPYHDFALQLDDEHYLDLAYGQLATFDPVLLPGLGLGYQEMIDFVRFVSGVRESGIPVAIVLAPHELQVNRALREALAEGYSVDLGHYDLGLPAFLISEAAAQIDPRIPVMDLTAPLAASAATGTNLYFGSNTHWSAEGNRLVGLILARFLAREWFQQDLALPEIGSHFGVKTPPTVDSSSWKVQRERALEEFLLPLLDDEPSSMTRLEPEEVAVLHTLSAPAMFGIQSVNGAQLEEGVDLSQPIPTPTRAVGFHVTGWAVDPVAEDLAAGVLVEVGDAVYRASYRLPREDVARSLANPKYRQSGFSLLLPPGEVEPGLVRLRILSLARDGAGFYAEEPITLLIENNPEA